MVPFACETIVSYSVGVHHACENRWLASLTLIRSEGWRSALEQTFHSTSQKTFKPVALASCLAYNHLGLSRHMSGQSSKSRFFQYIVTLRRITVAYLS